MTGNVALAWRQEALVTDEEQAKKVFRDSVQGYLPQGVTAAMSGFTGLTDATVLLTARLEVSGTLGTTTGKRLFLPGAFFEAKARPRFSSTTRVNPVYLPYAYTVEDHVKLALPEGMTVDNLPKDAQMSFAANAT
jgi:hypothetical protein